MPDDLDTAVQVITEVSAWLAGKDISWLIDFPGPFKKRIEQGEVYLAYLNDWKTLTGTVSLSREPDPELWISYPGQARYVHRLAVRRKFAGQGIGAALLDLAGHVAALEGVPWLRLDCSKDNQALQSYYLKQGFQHLDTVDLPHRLSGALFQKASRIVPQVKQLSGGRYSVPLLSQSLLQYLMPWKTITKRRKRTYRRDLIERLSAVESGQASIAAVTEDLVRADTVVLRAINEQLDYIRPSGIAWIQAIMLLVVSASIVVGSSIATVNESSVSYNTTSMHQDAQSARTIAFEGALTALADPSRTPKTVNSALNSALSQLQSAQRTDATADAMENGIGNDEIFTQIGLGVGSAFFGAVLGWLLNQILAALRWRRKERRELASQEAEQAHTT